VPTTVVFLRRCLAGGPRKRPTMRLPYRVALVGNEMK
jgi:hypothetical protein